MKSKISFLMTLLVGVVGIAGILLVNYQIIAAWFGKDGPANIGSIEVSYISMARFIKDFGFRTWAPFWYFGFPFHVFYTPILPFLEYILNTVFQIPLWQAYRLLTGIAYVVAPISLFLFGWHLSRRVVGGIIAGVFYAVGPTLLYFIDSGVIGDKFSSDFLDPRRFTILVRWGEGPHIFSIMFVPIVGIFYERFLHNRSFRSLLLGSIFLGLAGLTNAIGFFSAILLLIAMTFVHFVQTKEAKKRTLSAFFLIGGLAFGLISFWYNLTFLSTFFGEGGGTSHLILALFPWGWIGFFILALCIYYLFYKMIRNFALAFSLLWFGIFFTVVTFYYISAPAGESSWRIELLPQALRYTAEVDLSFSLLLGVLYAGIVGFFAKRSKVFEVVGILGAFVILGFSLLYIQPFLSVARKAAAHSVDLSATKEYEIAMWLKNHVNESKGERVFVPGNYGFYLNWFSNVWQHRGGLFQASTNKWPDHMHYQMANGTNSAIATAWFTIANTKYAVITTPASPELYREIKNTDRFTSYKIVYEKDGDIVYEVPLKRGSLAKPIAVDPLNSLAAPTKGDDKKALFAYADWIQNSSKNTSDVRVIDNDTYVIHGTVGTNEALLVQMTWDLGWGAVDTNTGAYIKTAKDPMGFLLLYPTPGIVSIVLTHGLTWKDYLGYLMTITTIVLIIRYVFVRRKSNTSKQSASATSTHS